MSLIRSIINNVFPERPDYSIVRELTPRDLLCNLNPTEVDGIIHLLPFSKPAVRATIHEAKFHHNEKAWCLLGEVLASYLKDYQSEALILPIPLSKKRQKHRRYNQVSKVAIEALSFSKHIKMSEKILVRLRDTKPQTSLNKTERQSNMVDAFGILNASFLQDKNIIVLDDVTTTGATLKAARATLNTVKTTSITLVSLAH